MYCPPDQTGRRIIITGSNSGTGKEAARRLAAAGASIVMAVRSLEKGQAARAEILDQVPDGRIDVRRIDLADLASVHAFAADILKDDQPIHTLVNNAGVMAPPTRQTTADGFELQLGANFLGPFALTNLLLPRLLQTPGARVATMTSMIAHRARIHWDDLQWDRRYSPWPSYGQSKLADMLMGLHLADLATARGWPLLSTLAHPGYTATNLQTAGPTLGTGRSETPLMFRLVRGMAVSRGVEPLLQAIADPQAAQGAYYGPRWVAFGTSGPARLPATARREDAERLWAETEALCGPALPPLPDSPTSAPRNHV